VRTRILNYSLSGAHQLDMGITYTAVAPTSRSARTACATVFRRPRAALLPAEGPRGTLTYVNYRQHSWGRSAVAVRAATAPSTALRTCVRAGQWHISGRGTLDGAKVIELMTATSPERLWVSATTFLPVRMVSSGPGVDTITFSFSFLAPTAANEALLSPPIPAGFSKRPL
jgi:hypothetical protein